MSNEADAAPAMQQQQQGALSPVNEDEAEALEVLKAALGALPETQVGREWLVSRDDNLYLRFLRGHKKSTAAALKYLKACAKWRAEYGTDEILKTFPQQTDKNTLLLRRFWPLARTGIDHQGRPVHFFNFAALDLTGLLAQTSMASLVRYNVYLAERAYQDHPTGGAVMLIDFPHFQVSDMGKRVKAIAQFIRAMAKVADPYYPESYAKIYMCRPDKMLQKLYQSLNLVLSQGTQAKVRMLKDEQCLEELRKVMPDDAIPVSMGGSSSMPIAPAGKVTAEAVKEVEARSLELSGDGGKAAPPARQSLAKRVSQRISQTLSGAK